MSKSDHYGDDGSFQREWCPECGDSVLAEHGDRKHCGKCGYTKWE